MDYNWKTFVNTHDYRAHNQTHPKMHKQLFGIHHTLQLPVQGQFECLYFSKIARFHKQIFLIEYPIGYSFSGTSWKCTTLMSLKLEELPVSAVFYSNLIQKYSILMGNYWELRDYIFRAILVSKRNWITRPIIPSKETQNNIKSIKYKCGIFRGKDINTGRAARHSNPERKKQSRAAFLPSGNLMDRLSG